MILDEDTTPEQQDTTQQQQQPEQKPRFRVLNVYPGSQGRPAAVMYEETIYAINSNEPYTSTAISTYDKMPSDQQAAVLDYARANNIIPSGTPEAPTEPRASVPNSIIRPGDEPIIFFGNGNGAYRGAIVGPGTRVAMADRNIETDPNAIYAFDIHGNRVKNAYYDVEDKRLEYYNVPASLQGTAFTFNDIAPGGVLDPTPTGIENIMSSSALDYYRKEPVQKGRPMVDVNYAGLMNAPPVGQNSNLKIDNSNTIMMAGIFPSNQKPMNLGGRSYSDPMGAMNIFNAGKGFIDTTDKGYKILNNAFYNPADRMNMKLITGAVSMGSGAIGGIVMGVGAGLGLIEAGTQDIVRGDTDHIIIPKTFSEGFTGGILGQPVNKTRTYNVPYYEGDRIVGSTTVNETTSYKMPSLPETLVSGLAPSAFGSNPDYLIAGGELIGTALLFGYGAKGLLKGRAGSIETMRSTTPDIVYKTFGEGRPVDVIANMNRDGMTGVNLENGAKLPGQLTDIGKVKGIPTSDLLYQRDALPVYDIVKGESPYNIGTMNIKGKVFDVNLEKNGDMPKIKSIGTYTLNDVTEPFLNRQGIDIAPKTSDTQFINRAPTETVPMISISDMDSGAKIGDIMEEPGKWMKRYTTDNYLMGGPADLLFERRPKTTFDQPGAGVFDYELRGFVTPVISAAGLVNVVNPMSNTMINMDMNINMDRITPQTNTRQIDDSKIRALSYTDTWMDENTDNKISIIGITDMASMQDTYTSTKTTMSLKQLQSQSVMPDFETSRMPLLPPLFDLPNGPGTMDASMWDTGRAYINIAPNFSFDLLGGFGKRSHKKKAGRRKK